MKKVVFLLKQSLFILGLITIIGFNSCSFQIKTKVYEETDIVKNSKRYRKDCYFSKTSEKHSPLLSLKKTFVKEINQVDEKSFEVYDQLNLSLNSFSLEPVVYMIIDDAHVFSFENLKAATDVYTKVSEDTQDVVLSDSTTVSVVTGYNTHQSRLIRFQYTLDSTATDKLLGSKKVSFRYYAGPSMMTVHLHQRDLKDVKKIIRSN